MTSVIAVVDYGAGNLHSVMKAFVAVGAAPRRAASPSELRGVDAVVVPGVGHFQATRALHSEWRRQITASIAAGTPALGICLGMQWLFEGSDESMTDPGLAILPGRCRRLTGDVKIPHVGWNHLDRNGTASRILNGIPDGAAMYFTHTFAVATSTDAAALTTHGRSFVSIVERGTVFGMQGHPEKSGAIGLRLLANFVAAARRRRAC